MRSGCLGMLLELGVWVLSTTLVTLGIFLLAGGAVFFSPTWDPAVIFTAVVVPVGAYLLIKVGRDILRDLRNLISKK